MVYVLMDSAYTRPVAVLAKPEKPDFLPNDAVGMIFDYKRDYRRGDTVGQWSSEMTGSIFTLITYNVL